MATRTWWAISAAVSLLQVFVLAGLWYARVTDYQPRPEQLAASATVDDYLAARPGSPDRLLIPTGVFIQSLHFATATDVNLTGYIWQRYAASVPTEITRGVALPEQVQSGSTVLEEAYRRPDGAGGEVIGWYFDVTVRQPFDYSSYPFDRHEVWLRMWHADFDRDIVLVPDLRAYDATDPGGTFGVDGELVAGGLVIEETLFEYKLACYDTDFGIDGYVGQREFPELYYAVVVTRRFVDAFVINLVPLVVVAGLLFSVVMMTTTDPERIRAFDMTTATAVGTSSALFFVVLLAHIRLRQEFTGAGVLYLEQFYFTVYFAILAVTINEYVFAAGRRGRVVAWVRYRDNLLVKTMFWPAILTALVVITVNYLGRGAALVDAASPCGGA